MVNSIDSAGVFGVHFAKGTPYRTMKTIKLMAVVSILASSALAQIPGFYVSAGGGLAEVKAGDFALTTSYGEKLKSKDAKNRVPVVCLDVGYQFNENWDLGLRFTKYSKAEINMDFPKFTGLVSIVPFPDYSRHVFYYDTVRLALVPSYTFAAGDQFRLRASAGAVCSQTRSHFEADYYIWYSGRPNEQRHDSYPTGKKTDWSYVASLGAEWVFTKYLSLGLTGTVSPYKISIPASQVGGYWPTQPSSSSVKVTTFETVISLIYRK